MEFKNYGLHSDLQKGIDSAGYVNCMPVQEQVFNIAFTGRDLYVQSQTGTGKTAAFLTVIFQRMMTEPLLSKRKALIMAPTRELAVQIEDDSNMLAKYLPIKTGSFYGGVGYTQQEKLLKENVQIMVGTPGRVLDLNKSGRMNLMDISFLVLDEADRMFDMGFYPDLRKLIKAVTPCDRRQTMLFSATLNSWVKNLAWEYTKAPFEIQIKPEIVTVDEVTQLLYHVSSEEKMTLLLGILKRERQSGALIIFCNTKKQTEIIAKRLKLNDIYCEYIIGDLPQSKRLKIIDDVKAGKIKILVATDVAARGLDIDNLDMVINFDVPNEAENYVHRIGRTARAGNTGKSFILASEKDVYELPAIERYIGKKIPSEIASRDLFEKDKSAGVHIRTDFYEERHHDHLSSSSSSSRRKNRVPEKSSGKSSEKSAGQKRHDTKKTHPVHAGKKIASEHKSANKPIQTRIEEAGKDSIQEQELSKLSMEERMALYRKKYAPNYQKPTESKEKVNSNKKQHKKPSVNKKFNKDNRKITNQVTDNDVTDNKMTINQKKEYQKKDEIKQIDVKRTEVKQVETSPPKKGIFAKIKGMFAKK